MTVLQSQRVPTVFTFVFAFILIAGALAHIFSPAVTDPMIPTFIPKWLGHGAALLAEGAIAISLLIPKTRWIGAFAFATLMVVFVPFHIWDLVREDPVVGSQTAAVIRLVVQALFIAGGVWAGQRLRPKTERYAHLDGQ